MFPITSFTQEQVALEQDLVDQLSRHLEFAQESFQILESELQYPLYLATPILATCCKSIPDACLLSPRVCQARIIPTLETELDLLIKRGNTCIAFLVVQKDDFNQAISDLLIACLILADLERLDTVYGIATNY